MRHTTSSSTGSGPAPVAKAWPEGGAVVPHRQREGGRRPVEPEPHRCRGRPARGPVAAGDDEAQHVAGLRVHVVASRSMSTSTHSPGTTGVGRPPGDADPSAGQQPRWGRFSRPRVINADVPSGSTSQSLTATWATGAEDRTRRWTDGLPASSAALGDRPVVGQRPGVVDALVRRLHPRQRAGARAPRRRPDVADDVELARCRRGRSSAPAAASPVAATCRPGATPRGARPGRAPVGPARRTNTCAGAAPAPRPAAEVLVEERDDLGVGVDVRDRVATATGSAWLHGPTSRRHGTREVARPCGTCCCGSRRPSRRRASSGS